MKVITRKEISWCFIITFIIKLISVWFFIYITKRQVPSYIMSSFSIYEADMNSYLTPFYNLYHHHAYFVSDRFGTVYTGRMPYYGLVYFFLLPFFNIPTIYSIMVVLQVILEALSIVLFSQIIFKYTQRKSIFYLTIFFMNLCLYITHFTASLSPESGGISLMIFAWWFYEKFKSTNKLLPIFLCGIMLNLLTGYKPYMGIMFFVVAFAILIKNGNQRFIFSLRALFFLSITMAITTSLWTWRNYRFNKQIVPLTTLTSGDRYANTLKASRNLFAAWGGSAEFWDPSAISSFFYTCKDKSGLTSGTFYKVDQIPKTRYYNNDSLLALREFICAHDLFTLSGTEDSLETIRINRFTESYRKEFPFHFYCLSPLHLVFNFTARSSSYYLSSILNGKENYLILIIKIFQSILYYIFLLGGFLGLIIYFNKIPIYGWVPFYLVLLFCFIIRSYELRYFLYAYPSLVFGLMIILDHLIQTTYLSGMLKRVPILKHLLF
jgi:hypothetical protein